MAKTRLTKLKRCEMLSFIEKKVTCKKSLVKDYERKHDAFEKLFRKYILSKYPEKDMDVLIKYNVGVSYNTFDINAGNAIGYFSVSLKKSVKVVNGHNYFNSSDFGKFPEELKKALTELQNAKKEKNIWLENIKNKYRLVVKNSRTFEEALLAWPELKEIEKDICSENLPSLLTKEVITEIQKDMERRKNDM
jgi:mRNA-degrading endonuclease HigB of HigAB toxin-antitoxin module